MSNYNTLLGFCVGDIAKVVSGELSGYEVVILSLDPSSETAKVAIAVFGGTKAVPFEIGINQLAK